MKSIKYAACVLAFGSMTMLAGAQSAKPQKMNGWIGESKCGAKMHDPACVKKCIDAGAKPVFIDSEKKVWTIDNADAVSNYYGEHVKVRATVDTTDNSIHIDKVKKTGAMNKM